MITPKDYIWPAIKKATEIIWGVLSEFIVATIISSACIAIVYYLRWFSLIVFGIIAFCGYIWYEARFNYKFEKEEVERKARDHLAWMIHLPAYWGIEEEEKKNNDSYKQATKEFLQIMDEYERKYGKNEFYERIHSEWLTADRYLRDALTNKTF